ncbi:neutral zinc metallopeptidase [Kribbella voronezhensis]|uniref:neutral zinc metallopeptidase n=1 Tax=Kribbella voronezhensis TaxID=2512212 RepID=UPI001062A298|nr:neutral zinc metallopeptidase [Kribbella voronezhensis]
MTERLGTKLLGVGAVLALLVGGGAVALRRTGTTNATWTAVRATPTPAATPSAAVSPGATTTTTPAEQPLAASNRAVMQNALYRVGQLPASHCKEPAARPTSVAQVKAYYTESIRCLDRAWAPVIRKAGFTFWSPRLEVLAPGQVRTQCAISDSGAYCNGVISMRADFDLTNQRRYDRLWTRTTMAFLIAHEYGHHIQRLTGIMAASDTRANYANGTDARLTESRRLELQASCFSGVYLGADRRYFPATGAWLKKWLWTVAHRGDEWNPERSHGNKTSHSRWSRRGLSSASPASCNTFTAAPAAIA